MRHAPNNAGEELPPSSLRGRLCEVFFSAVLTEMIDPLMHRLGEKAELDDPIFGAAAELDPMRARLNDWKRFLLERDATYDRTITIVGADRDVTEGTLELRAGGEAHKTIPIAILMERRREREVALRVYMATSALETKAMGPSHGGAPPEVVGTIPIVAADFLAAVSRRDAEGVAACFEQESSVRDASGIEHGREAAARILTTTLVVHGVADNGQVCALEVALGDSKRLGLLVLARGDSGLIRSLRIYSET